MADATTLKVKADADQAKREFIKLGDKVEDFGDQAKGVAATAGVAFAGMAAGIGVSLKKAGDFQASLRGVGKTTGLSGQALEKMGDRFKSLSERIPVSTKKLLGIGQAAGQLGVTGAKNIRNFATTIAKLGSASDIQGEQAATALTRILNVTGSSIDKIDELGSVVVRMGNNFAATESEIVRMTTEVARSTAAFDTSYDQAVALGTAMKSLGIQAQLGGSAVGKSFRKIEKALNEGGEGLQTLEELTGQTADVLRKRFANDAVGVFQDFIEGLGRATKQGSVAAEELAKLGLKGDEVNKVLPVLAERSGILGKALSSAADETKNATALNKEAAVAFDQFNSDLSRAKNSLGNLASEIGKAFIPMARSLLQTVTGMASSIRKFFSGLSDTTKQIIAGLGALATALTGAVASFAAIGVAAGAAIGPLTTFWTFLTGSLIPTLGSALVAAAGAAATALKGLAVVLIANPIGATIAAITAAVAGLYIAWESNFGGIQDITVDVLGAVKGVIDNFISAASKGLRGFNDVLTGAFTLDGERIREGLKNIGEAIDSQVKAAAEGYQDTHDKRIAMMKAEEARKKEQAEREKEAEDKIAQAKREAHEEAMAQIKVNSQAIARAQKEEIRRTEEQVKKEKEAREEAARVRREREDEILQVQIRNVERRTIQEAKSQEELKQGQRELNRLYEEQFQREVDRINRTTESEKVAAEKIKTAEFELAQKKKELDRQVADQKADLHDEELQRIEDRKQKEKEAAREAAQVRKDQIREAGRLASDLLRGGPEAAVRSGIRAGVNAYAPGFGGAATAAVSKLSDIAGGNADLASQRRERAEFERNLNNLIREEARATRKFKEKQLREYTADERRILERAKDRKEDLESQLQAAIREKRRQTKEKLLEQLKERTADEREILQQAHDRRVGLENKLQSLLEKKRKKEQSEEEKKLAEGLRDEQAVLDVARSRKEELERERNRTFGQLQLAQNEEEKERLRKHLNDIEAELKTANEQYIQAEKEFKKKDIQVRKELGIEQKKTLKEQIAETKEEIEKAKKAELDAQKTLKSEKLRIRKELGIEERKITQENIDKLKKLVREGSKEVVEAADILERTRDKGKEKFGVPDKKTAGEKAREARPELVDKLYKDFIKKAASPTGGPSSSKEYIENLRKRGVSEPAIEALKSRFDKKFHEGGRVRKYHAGGQVARREVFGLLEEDEEVIRRRSAIANRPLLKAINAANGPYQPPPSEVILRVEGEGAFAKAVQESLVTETALGTGAVTVKTGSED